MTTKTRIAGAAVATTAAALFALAPIASVSAEEMVKCMGANSCKGHSSCKTANSECKGLNSCKGQGWVELSKKACEDAGGKPS
ncbi:MAG: hypothetical protein H6983_08270 [Ectothiorhodospiraceae bacterium]|nr:hypothetical protein [Chromatiales bacterium]MCP5154142.1 hypothetical protein [Ectothiorhodospiraceae bacterium]